VTPTARTLGMLRAQGWVACVVERWVKIPRDNANGLPESVRKDAWGFGDVLACHPRGRRVALFQVTTASNAASRLAKAKERSELRAWLQSGAMFEVHGWEQRNGRWHCRRTAVELGDLDALRETTVAVLPRRRRKDRYDTPLELFAALEG
jgi:hypothetical protein